MFYMVVVQMSTDWPGFGMYTVYLLFVFLVLLWGLNGWLITDSGDFTDRQTTDGHNSVPFVRDR